MTRAQIAAELAGRGGHDSLTRRRTVHNALRLDTLDRLDLPPVVTSWHLIWIRAANQ